MVGEKRLRGKESEIFKTVQKFDEIVVERAFDNPVRVLEHGSKVTIESEWHLIVKRKFNSFVKSERSHEIGVFTLVRNELSPYFAQASVRRFKKINFNRSHSVFRDMVVDERLVVGSG